ncbi:MAG TPA: hypothetical protein VGK63_08500 [Candidatus Limnocylindrales bacterium]
MSKRHQASRRRAYGRRQHEIHERTTRREEPVDLAFDAAWDAAEQRSTIDLGFARHLRLALGD